MIGLLLLRLIINSNVLSQLLELLPMISDYLMYLKALESSLLDLPKLQETESLPPREAA
jgi:hypothetical protein